MKTVIRTLRSGFKGDKLLGVVDREFMNMDTSKDAEISWPEFLEQKVKVLQRAGAPDEKNVEYVYANLTHKFWKLFWMTEEYYCTTVSDLIHIFFCPMKFFNSDVSFDQAKQKSFFQKNKIFFFLDLKMKFFFRFGK